jgi:SAM-dependent methyltransferase
MEYGCSDHYLGQQGERYLEGLNEGGRLRGQMDVWKFSPWIGEKDSVLDFGCGPGWMLYSLNAASKCGVELNPAARRVCQENGIEVYPEIAAVPAGRTFSRIISHHCLEHVPYPVAALRSLRARLQDDGLLILVVPIDDWRCQLDATGKDGDHHLYTWTPRLLANTLFEGGFECQQVEVLTHAWPVKWETLQRTMPRWAFDSVCWFWGWARKRRQLRAVAGKRPEA